jgi:hypothetical protein
MKRQVRGVLACEARIALCPSAPLARAVAAGGRPTSVRRRAHPADLDVGSITLKRIDDSPQTITGPIVARGAAVTVMTTIPGQRATWSFAGTAGQIVSVQTVSSIDPGRGHIDYEILKPDGGEIVDRSANTPLSAPGTQLFNNVTLPVDGVYTLYADPADLDVGAITMELS